MKIFATAVLVALLSPFCLAQQSHSILVKEGKTLSMSDAHPDGTTDSHDDGISPYYEEGYKAQNSIDDSEKINFTFLPHPYLNLGGSLMPGGYSPLAGFVRGGLEIESRDVIADISATYDNGHKTNDNDQPNANGHDRYLRGGGYWRLSVFSRPKWFAGGGYRWSQLSTTNYTKGGSRPQFGGGYDLYIDRLGSERACPSCWFSARLMVNWVMAGTDWQNGSHGPEFTMVMPRPIEKRHLFMTYTIGVYRFHTTVTDPKNIQMTREQRAKNSVDSTFDFGLMYRFW